MQQFFFTETRDSAITRDHVTCCQLKSCQLLQSCMTNLVCKGSQKVNDLEGHSRSLELPPFDGPYITSYQRSVVTTTPSGIVCFWDITTWSVHVTSCDLQKSLVFENIVEITSKCTFWLIYKPIVDNTCHIIILPRYEIQKRFKQQKWPTRSFKVSSNSAIW